MEKQELTVLKTEDLRPFPGNPFHLVEDEQLMELSESIREFGMAAPILTRLAEDGDGYEVVAGQRRVRASELAGIESVPAFVLPIDRDRAIITLVDSNIQRESVLPSERAFAYKMKLDAMKRQGYRTDLTSNQVGAVDKINVHKRVDTKDKVLYNTISTCALCCTGGLMMDTAKELQVLHEELIREIDEKIGQMLKKLQNENDANHQKNHVQTRAYESVYPLNMGTGIYKGKRPTAVIFPGEARKECPTWKKVMEEILKDCCKDPARHQMLMDLRGKILGRNRVLLGSETGKMRSPVKIGEALFVETHYDTETLLRILTTRILDEVGYDYGKIQIAVRTE